MKELDDIFYGDGFLNKGLNLFIDEVNKKGLKFSKNEITDYYNNQEITQLFKPVSKPLIKKILIYKPFDRVYCDSMFITSAKISLINIIDYFTKYSMITVFRKESVTAEDALKAFKKFNDFVESEGYIINKVYTDNGSEFKSVFDKYLKKEFITHVFTDPDDKRQVSPIESFNRTVRLSFEKYIAVNGLDITKISKVFEKINKSYNETVHSRTKERPLDMVKDENKQKAFTKQNETEQQQPNYIKPYKSGTMVRLPLKKGVFDKLKASWSKKLYKIVSFNKQTQRYKIDGVDTPFPQWYLQPVSVDKLQIYKPEKEGKSKEEVEAERKKERKVKKAEKELQDYTTAGKYYKETRYNLRKK